MRGGIVAIGLILMIVGGALFLSTTTQPIEFLGIKIGEVRKQEAYLKVGGIEFPLNTIGMFLGFLGFMTFIAGLAASPKH